MARVGRFLEDDFRGEHPQLFRLSWIRKANSTQVDNCSVLLDQEMISSGEVEHVHALVRRACTMFQATCSQWRRLSVLILEHTTSAAMSVAGQVRKTCLATV